MKKTSVITDAVSPNFLFPLWHQYYGSLFGNNRLFVVTYEGLSELFRDFELGGIWEIPFRYEDHQRARSISSIVTSLLTASDVVIRVDTDEFLVADPRKYKNLIKYIDEVNLPYVTARGMNVIQSRDEPPINFSEPILFRQRKWVQPVGPLNKTSLTAIPMLWGAGFHWSSHYPQFDDLFLFHLKHVDFELEIEFAEWMRDYGRDNPNLVAYYSRDSDRILAHRNNFMAYPIVQGSDALYRAEFTAKFLTSVRFTTHMGLYHGDQFFEETRILLDENLAGIF